MVVQSNDWLTTEIVEVILEFFFDDLPFEYDYINDNIVERLNHSSISDVYWKLM